MLTAIQQEGSQPLPVVELTENDELSLRLAQLVGRFGEYVQLKQRFAQEKPLKPIQGKAKQCGRGEGLRPS